LEGALKAAEPMIGHHDQCRPGQSAPNFADDVIDCLIALKKFAFMLSPQHVRVLVNY
jgi:hypothetical protein